MSASSSPLEILSTQLCPWLKPAFDQLEKARCSGRLGHAWLITGPIGSGKLNLALAFAARLLAGAGVGQEPPLLRPQDALRAMAEHRVPSDHHPDLHVIHPEEDKRSISVEQVRDVIDAIALTAHRGAAKVVVLDPADALTTAAANALLKTLEEPSGDTYLLLLCHQPGRLPATIRSRCQRLGVGRSTEQGLVEWLEGTDSASIRRAWRISGGAPLLTARLAQSNDLSENSKLLDLLCSICEDKIGIPEAANAWAKGDTELGLAWLLRELADAARTAAEPGLSTPVTDPVAARLHNAWRNLPTKTLFEQYDRAERLLGQLGSGINLEVALQALLAGFQANRGLS